jgi:hypothetical protein
VVVVVAALVIWRWPKAEMVEFCALGSDEVGMPTLEQLEKKFEAMARVAPESIRDDAKKQLAFLREEPELNRLLTDQKAMMALSDAQKSQLAADVKVATEKYDLLGTSTRIGEKREEVCRGDKPRWLPRWPSK